MLHYVQQSSNIKRNKEGNIPDNTLLAYNPKRQEYTQYANDIYPTGINKQIVNEGFRTYIVFKSNFFVFNFAYI